MIKFDTLNKKISKPILSLLSGVMSLAFIYPPYFDFNRIDIKTLTFETKALVEQNADKIDTVESLSMVRLPDTPARKARKTVYLTVTAYSSSVDECDSDPFTTASGSKVHDGTVAYNHLPFGAKVRFPEVYGDKVFTVEDRLGGARGPYIADMWKPSKAEAKIWGAKVLKMEVL